MRGCFTRDTKAATFDKDALRQRGMLSTTPLLLLSNAVSRTPPGALCTTPDILLLRAETAGSVSAGGRASLQSLRLPNMRLEHKHSLDPKP